MEIQPDWSRHVGGKHSEDVRKFLDKSNRDLLHERLIDAVYARTSGAIKISTQSDTQLQTIMIRVAHSGENLYATVQELNEITVRECVDSILHNVSHYLHYVHDMKKNTSRYATVERPLTTRSSREMTMQSLI